MQQSTIAKVAILILVLIFSFQICLLAGGAVMINRSTVDFSKCKATATVKDSCKRNDALLGGGIAMVIIGGLAFLSTLALTVGKYLEHIN